MENIKKVYSENKETTLLLIIPIAIIAKLIEHLVLPTKYFYDSTRMLGMMLDTGSMSAWGGSYEVTVDIFSKLNIFNFTTLLQWSICIGVIFNIILLIIFSKTKGFSFLQGIFALMCIGLCNIYVFNLGKDIIQFTLFVICFLVISITRIPNWLKVAGCALVFYWESTFFRNYYIIMSAFTVVVYFIFSYIRKKQPKLNVIKCIMIVATLFLSMFVFLSLAQTFMPDEYMDIMVCKEQTTQLGASTTIDDKIEHNGNIYLFMGNYMINFARMIFPVELLTGGVFYMPFLLFQILLLYYMYKNIRNIHRISEKNVIALCVFIAFFMGSVLFEPDFGSFARHEAAAFPIIILFALDNVGVLGKEKKNDTKAAKVVIYK